MTLDKFIQDVVPGDTIVEKNGRTEVKRVDTIVCKHHTHINDKDCYDNNVIVRVRVRENVNA